MSSKESNVLRGMQAIADYLEVSRPTVHRYIVELGLPCVNPGPGGHKGSHRVTTTKSIIDHWIIAISNSSMKYPIGGPPMLLLRRIMNAAEKL